MDKKYLLAIGVVVLIGTVGVFLLNNSSHSTSTNNAMLPDKNNKMIQQTPNSSPETMLNKDDHLMKNDKMNTSSSRYIDYSKTAFDDSVDKKRVYFFHAKWCPTCKAANTEINSNLDKIPPDVIVFKTDYDTQKDLKIKYAVTYQHTFVLVDKNGAEIKKWDGGGIEEIIKNTKN